MKSLLALLLALSFATAGAAEPKTIQLSDVTKRVSDRNYLVRANALKVYQAKANIEVARGALLPKLNLWTIVSAVVDPSSLIDKIPEIAPFLVPGNWFRVNEVQLLHLAEREGYRALWANEIYTAKALYLQLLLDEKLLRHVQAGRADLERIHRIVLTREVFGGVRPGTAREVEIRLLGLAEDERNMKVLLVKERAELSYALGFAADTALTLKDVAAPEMEKLKPLNTGAYEFRVLSASPERRQFDHFLSVVSQIKEEIKYSFLGVSTISRGAAGGVFDSLPVPDGLGFGSSAAVGISDAQKEILRTQKRGVEETLKRQLVNLAAQYNADLQGFEGVRRRLELARASKESILRRISLGEDVDVLALAESAKNQMQAETSVLQMQARVLTMTDRLSRLTFTGDYAKSPSTVTAIRGGR